MPCPPPKSLSEPSKAAALKAEAEHRAECKDARIATAVRLHKGGETHTVISKRLGITMPTLRKWLRDAGFDGYAAKPHNEVVEPSDPGLPANPVSRGYARGECVSTRGAPRLYE